MTLVLPTRFPSVTVLEGCSFGSRLEQDRFHPERGLAGGPGPHTPSKQASKQVQEGGCWQQPLPLPSLLRFVLSMMDGSWKLRPRQPGDIVLLGRHSLADSLTQRSILEDPQHSNGPKCSYRQQTQAKLNNHDHHEPQATADRPDATNVPQPTTGAGPQRQPTEADQPHSSSPISRRSRPLGPRGGRG